MQRGEVADVLLVEARQELHGRGPPSPVLVDRS